MASWSEFEAEAPEFAAAGRRLLIGPDENAIGFLATVGAGGVQHLAPVCPIFCGNGLYLCAGSATPKRRDLEQDGRYVLHAFLAENDEEFQIAGRAARIEDSEEIAAVHAAIGFSFQKQDPLFRFDLERCLWGCWENVGQPDTRPHRRRWRAG